MFHVKPFKGSGQVKLISMLAPLRQEKRWKSYILTPESYNSTRIAYNTTLWATDRR
jgi:hypothetical protein